MSIRTRAAAAAATAVLLAPAWLAATTTVQARSLTPLTYQAITAMSPKAQAALLDPLRDAAGAVDAYGRGPGRSIYAGVELDPPAHSVHLYLTDLSQKRDFLAHARAGNPKADLSIVTVLGTRYTRVQLHAARDRIAAHLTRLPVEVQNATVPPDGSGLILGVSSRTTSTTLPASAVHPAAPALSQVAQVAVKVTPGQVFRVQDRYGDSSPFYAGDFITNGGWHCTTGIPVKDSTGHQYMVFASHCGHTGTVWVTGRGVTVGKVVKYDEHWDAALIDTGSARFEYDGPPGPVAANSVELNDTRYSYVNDLVCQDGYTSGVMCNIRVTNQDVQTFQVRGDRYGNTFTARGVLGDAVSGYCGVQGGDSGGLVFAVNSSSTRQVRGIVSSSVDGTNCRGIFWTEALDIYNDWGLHLTDRTY